MYKLYGIPNCDTVKKARAFLEKINAPVAFVDFKKSPPQKTDLERWSLAFGGLPVNEKGSTYKKYKDKFEKLSNRDKFSFLSENASMIKRPILEKDGVVLSFGFKESEYSEFFK